MIACMKERTQHFNSKRAFTLIEMMVVMAIIVILLTMVLPVVFRSRARASIQQAQAEANSLVLAIKSYRTVFGKWPAQIDNKDHCYFTNNHLIVTQLMGFNSRERSFINIQTTNLDSRSNYLDPHGVPYVIFIRQSGVGSASGSASSFSNQSEYTPEREVHKFYQKKIKFSVHVTNNLDVGAGAFLDNTNSLSATSWGQ